ncbi:hypothetical protein HK405_015120 [Cladochytrium tenue]|nr:hypothetical protein HK405_015120 [Cladochytrium tenue]
MAAAAAARGGLPSPSQLQSILRRQQQQLVPQPESHDSDSPGPPPTLSPPPLFFAASLADAVPSSSDAMLVSSSLPPLDLRHTDAKSNAALPPALRRYTSMASPSEPSPPLLASPAASVGSAVQVAIRLRPMFAGAAESGGSQTADSTPTDTAGSFSTAFSRARTREAVVVSGQSRKAARDSAHADICGTEVVVSGRKKFSFNTALPGHVSQQHVYTTLVAPLVEQFLEGFNVTVMAYGQTGTGKTYTMGSAREYVSFDELGGSESEDTPASERPTIVIQDTPSGSVRFTENRQTSATDMNLLSSRSHAIFTVNLRQTIPTGLDAGRAGQRTVFSRFNFVDLAGSERLQRTGSVGARQREGIFINSGLLALGNVISALANRVKNIATVNVEADDLDNETRRLRVLVGQLQEKLDLLRLEKSTPDAEADALRDENRSLRRQLEEQREEILRVKAFSDYLSNELAYVQSEASLSVFSGASTSGTETPAFDSVSDEAESIASAVPESVADSESSLGSKIPLPRSMNRASVGMTSPSPVPGVLDSSGRASPMSVRTITQLSQAQGAVTFRAQTPVAETLSPAADPSSLPVLNAAAGTAAPPPAAWRADLERQLRRARFDLRETASAAQDYLRQVEVLQARCARLQSAADFVEMELAGVRERARFAEAEVVELRGKLESAEISLGGLNDLSRQLAEQEARERVVEKKWHDTEKEVAVYRAKVHHLETELASLKDSRNGFAEADGNKVPSSFAQGTLNQEQSASNLSESPAAGEAILPGSVFGAVSSLLGRFGGVELPGDQETGVLPPSSTEEQLPNEIYRLRERVKELQDELDRGRTVTASKSFDRPESSRTSYDFYLGDEHARPLSSFGSADGLRRELAERRRRTPDGQRGSDIELTGLILTETSHRLRQLRPKASTASMDSLRAAQADALASRLRLERLSSHRELVTRTAEQATKLAAVLAWVRTKLAGLADATSDEGRYVGDEDDNDGDGDDAVVAGVQAQLERLVHARRREKAAVQRLRGRVAELEAARDAAAELSRWLLDELDRRQRQAAAASATAISVRQSTSGVPDDAPRLAAAFPAAIPAALPATAPAAQRSSSSRARRWLGGGLLIPMRPSTSTSTSVPSPATAATASAAAAPSPRPSSSYSFAAPSPPAQAPPSPCLPQASVMRSAPRCASPPAMHRAPSPVRGRLGFLERLARRRSRPQRTGAAAGSGAWYRSRSASPFVQAA